VQVPRDREEPRGQVCVRLQPVCVLHQPQPGLLEQILGDVMPAGQAQQKSEQPKIEGGVKGVEGRLVAAAKLLDQRQLGFMVHRSHNARRAVA